MNIFVKESKLHGIQIVNFLPDIATGESAIWFDWFCFWFYANSDFPKF